jgi:hypothetical protein
MKRARVRSAVFAVVMLCVVVSVQAQTNFVLDNFTGANGTTLQAHTSDRGGAMWVRLLGSAGSNLVLQTNRLEANVNQNQNIYTNGNQAPNAEYAVGMAVIFNSRAFDADCATASLVNCTDGYGFVFGRGDVTAQNGYVARISGNGQLVLIRVVGGVQTLLASTTVTVTLGQQYSLVLSIKNAQKAVYWNNSATPTLTSADNTVTGATGPQRIGGIGMNRTAASGTILDQFFEGTFAPTEARMLSYSATIDDDGRVLVDWKTAQEKNSLGFRVWREDGRRRVQVGPMVAGAAFLTRGAMLPAGNAYRQFDRVVRLRRASAYWIEELDVHGRSTWFGPIEPESGTIDPTFAPSRPMASLSRIEVPAPEPPVAVASESFAISADAAAPSALAQQWLLAASKTAIKIHVDTEGWYRITAAELFAAGLPAKTSPKALQLYVDGKPIPMTVEGEADGKFDNADAIRFYGTPLDNPSTNRRVYWLNVVGGSGTRISVLKAGTVPTPPASFAATAQRRDKVLFDATLDNGEGEGFFGPLVSTDPADPTPQTLTLLHIDTSFAASQLEVSLQGATEVEGGLPHRIELTVNGHEAGEVELDGHDRETFRMNIPTAWLVEGTNTVGLAALNGDSDISVVQLARITYPHTYVADADRLLFTASTGVRLTGFSSNSVRALDVTSPDAPIEVTPTAANGAVTVALPKGGKRRVLAMTSAGFAHPARLELNVPSTLHGKGADLVIVAHRTFVNALAPLAALHRAERLTVAVASIDDVYDEFSFGAIDPAAIRAYLKDVRTSTRPRGVLLVGDTTIDPRNYLGFGELDFVPTKILPTTLLRTSSDGWFTDFNNDLIPDVAIGRIPVRTAQATTNAVAKIVAYAAVPAGQSWSQRALFVSDYDPEELFRPSLQPARAAVPAGMTAIDIDMADGLGVARPALLSEWNAGASLINYFGHGSVEVWTGGGLLSNGDVASLTNASRLPFVAAMTCLNGYYHDVFTSSLAEAMLAAPSGGAIGVFTSSSLTTVENQKNANTAFVTKLLAGGTFGEAALAAWQGSPSSDFRISFQLFGDPLLRLRR